MSPVPVPRAVWQAVIPLAVMRGPGRVLVNAQHLPNLEVTGPLAIAAAAQWFQETWTAALDQAVAARGHPATWTARHQGDVMRFVVQGFQVREVRELWAMAVYAVSRAAGSPGIEVREPRFRSLTRMDRRTGQPISAVQIEGWPGGSRVTSDGHPPPPVRFRSDRAPGYLDLLERSNTGLYAAEGYMWRATGRTLEGFRLAVLPPARVDGHLGRLPGRDAGVGRAFPPEHDPTARASARLSTYDCQDLVLCLFEAFHRQRDAWATEHVQLPDGRRLRTTPWRLLGLDPHALRARLDPGRTWGANWRRRLFDRLMTLTMFERQTRTRTGQVLDAGDRLVHRVLDGRRALDDDAPPDAGVGLVSILHRAGVLPVDALFVEISFDFMARLLTWVVDVRGAVHWGAAAAPAAEQVALAAQPEDRRGARRMRAQLRQHVRAQPYYLHSPRLLTLGNLEGWSVRRKLLAYALLQEMRPPHNGRRDTHGHTRRRPQRHRQAGRQAVVCVEGQDYVACNGAYGHGYRVATWLRKAAYHGRRALRAFLADLTALQHTLDLRLELRAAGRQSTGPAAWDGEALAVLAAYGRTPARAGDFRRKIYLPVNLETQLRARLAAVGIEAVEDGEEGVSRLTPVDGPAPADLRLARRQAGWTQAALAQRLGVSKATISQWECGTKPIPRRRLPRLRMIIARCLAPTHGRSAAGASP